jgi:hypothetical protein
MTYRPRKQTEDDLSNEYNAAEKIYQNLGLKCLKLGEVKYRIDWCLSRHGTIVAWGEYKFRNVPKDKYDTLILSSDRWFQLKRFGENSGLPAILFVEWFDKGLHFVNSLDVGNHLVRYVEGGDYAGGHPGDIEPVVHIPINLFEPV